MPDWSTKHHKVTKPTGDDEYFERMSRIIFNAGLNWRVLESKWPGTKKAFDNFNVNKVAKYDELKIDELMVDPDVIHNLAKIRAIIANAQEIQKVTDEHGSFAKYLASLQKTGEDEMRKAISKRFGFLGKGTTVIFLFAVGEKQPKAMAEWQARHQS